MTDSYSDAGGDGIRGGGQRAAGSGSPAGNGGDLIQRRNLGSDVYRVLWDRILDRQLHPGEKLSDLRLSEELGVSRTPVREALHRLEKDGVVIAEPNRGFFVASYDRRDIEEIYELRAALEAFALRHAAIVVSEADLQHQLDELDRVERLLQEAVTDNDRTAASDAFLEVDRGFHSFLLENSNNRRLVATLDGLWAQIAVFQKAGLMIAGWVDKALDDHRIILNHLLASNTDAAAMALEAHILNIQRRVLADFSLDGTAPATPRAEAAVTEPTAEEDA
ncbi:MAG: GntR family transcriptional regulator [Thermomicrobiales bacterium]